jgi:hypothetical protein
MDRRVKISNPSPTEVTSVTQHGHESTPCDFPYTSSESQKVVYDSYKRTVGWDIVDYNRRRRNGELLPHTPFDQVEWERTTNTGTLTVTWNTGCIKQITTNFAMDFMGHFIVDDPVNNPIEEQLEISLPSAYSYVETAAARCYEKGHDTLTFLAELGEVARMLRGVYQKIILLKQGKTIGEIEDLWLEGRYGWRTLWYDILDIHEALTKFDSARTRWSERAGLTVAEVVYDQGLYDTTYTDVQIDRETTYTIGVRGSVVADFSPPRFRFNPLATAWELVPYSFVLDWVVNVGQAISTLSFILLAQKYEASYGYEVKVNRTDIGYGVDTDNSTVDASFSHTEKLIWQVRVPTTVSYFPPLKLDLSWAKGLDLIALIRQVL